MLKKKIKQQTTQEKIIKELDELYLWMYDYHTIEKAKEIVNRCFGEEQEEQVAKVEFSLEDVRKLQKQYITSHYNSKIYIAGGITGNPNYIEQFNKAEQQLEEKGYIVLNPVKPVGFSYKDYIDIGLNELMKCDAIYLLKGYEKSKGALLELKYAETIGMEIIKEEATSNNDN